jgi:hypothetical protein
MDTTFGRPGKRCPGHALDDDAFISIQFIMQEALNV